MRVVNPIRDVLDQIDLSNINPDKPLIALSIGDPTAFPNMPTHDSVSNAVVKQLNTKLNNGYGPADGQEDAKAAVAELLSRENYPLAQTDVVLTSGCSHALQMSIEVLCNPGSTLLYPCPGFPLYATLAHHLRVETAEYKLRPAANEDEGWEADLEHFEQLAKVRS